MLTLTIKFPKVSNSALCSGPMLSSPKVCLFLFRAGNDSCDFPNSCSRTVAVWGGGGQHPIGAHLFILRRSQNATEFSCYNTKMLLLSWGFAVRTRCQNRVTPVKQSHHFKALPSSSSGLPMHSVFRPIWVVRSKPLYFSLKAVRNSLLTSGDQHPSNILKTVLVYIVENGY